MPLLTKACLRMPLATPPIRSRLPTLSPTPPLSPSNGEYPLPHRGKYSREWNIHTPV